MNMSHYDLTKQFWDGTDDNGTQLSIDKDGIKHCLLRALNDFTSRTEKRQNNTTNGRKHDTALGPTQMLDDLENICLSKNHLSFLDEFVNYFTKKEKDENAFDAWHHEMCELFLNYFKADFVELQYGKAQKIVNMTFKNIYCLQGADQKEDHFKHCHMPLDSFTLEWFYRVGKTKKNAPTIKGKKVAKKYPSWSKLKFGTFDGLYSVTSGYTYYYIDLQDFIRTYIKDNCAGNCTPLQAEFLIWPQIQFELAAEGFYSQLVKIDDTKKLQGNQDFKKLDIKSKRKWFENNYQTINFSFIENDLSNL